MRSHSSLPYLDSSSVLGWLSSTTVIFLPILAIPCNWCCERIGNRKTALIGALLTGSGYLWTSFVLDRIGLLFAAQSLFGMGYAVSAKAMLMPELRMYNSHSLSQLTLSPHLLQFTFWASNSLAAQYFVRKRGLAVGIVYAGSGVGGFVFSIGLSSLIESVGLEWGVRIWALIAFAVLIPTSWTLKPKRKIKRPAFSW